MQLTGKKVLGKNKGSETIKFGDIMNYRLFVFSLFLFIALFFVIAPFAAKAISLIIRQFEGKTQIPGLIPTTLVSMVLF